MGSSKLIGTSPDQVPTNADLGTLAFQDANAVKIGGGDVVANHYVDTAISEVKPSLLLDFANSKTLDPRITFTRSTTAMYYDGKTTAMAEQNLQIYSQDFTNAAYTQTGLSISKNSGVAPDGTLTADYFVESSGGSRHAFIGVTTRATTYTFSIYAKSAGRDYILLYSNGAAKGSYFNLANGTIPADLYGAPDAKSITSVGNGWYRCSITVTSSALNYNEVYLANGSTSGSYSYSGDGVNGVYLWGMQVEERSSASAYTPTTSSPITNYIPSLQTAAAGVPRFDHDPITGESKGLLIEEQRTNLVTNSEYCAATTWNRSSSGGKVTYEEYLVGSPVGGFVRVKCGNSTSWDPSTLAQMVTVADNTIYAISFWARQVSGRTKTLSVVLNDGSTAATLTNQWQRYTIIYSNMGAGSKGLRFDRTPSSDVVYDIAGVQMEVGSFATSYIPTTSAQVTRSVDVASITGANFSSWYRQDEGTIDVDYTFFTSGGYPDVYNISDSTSSNRFHLWFDGSNGYSLFSESVAGSVKATLTYNASRNISNRTAAAYSNAGIAIATNTWNVSNAANTIHSQGLNKLSIGSNFAGSNVLNGTIKRLAYYPKRLSNAELQEMTQ